MHLPRGTFLKVIKLTVVSLLLHPFAQLKAETTFPPITVPQTTMPAQPQQNSDRSGNSGAAAAAAAAGAAMAGLGCIMGLKAAQEAPPDQKAMLQMMAMQQCAQAAQNAASAGKNNDQKKNLDAPPTTPMASFQPSAMPQQKDDEKSNSIDFSKLLNSGGEEPTSTPTTTIAPIEVPQQADNKTPSVDNKEKPLAEIAPPPTSTPELMDKNTITGKSNASDQVTPSTEASRAFGSALAGKGSADDLLKKALADNTNNANDTPMIRPQTSRRGDGGSEGFSSGGGSSGGETKGADPFENLLSQMLGGGQVAAVMDSGVGGGTQILSLAKDKTGKPKLNIFQFASTVYTELAHNGKRVSMRPRKNKNPSERSLSSVTNTVMNASVR